MVGNIIGYFKQPRHLFQLLVLLIIFALGLQFYLYVRQAAGSGPITISRPSGVDGFLPIGALMGWKRFLLAGQWDMVHPAAMVILGWAVALSIALRKAFCGWFCPVGTISEWCWQIGRRIFGRSWRLPVWLDIPLRGVKYLLLGLFLWAIGTMDTGQIAEFMHSPYYKLSDVKMLHFFTRMSALTAIVLLVLVLLSFITQHFWCRYLCPYGALLGVFSIFSPSRIRRRESSCIECGRCDRVCPCHLPVSRKRSIVSPECIGCMDCVAACPAKQTLALSCPGLAQRFWTVHKAALFIGLFLVLTVYLAQITGHWRSGVPDMEVRARLAFIDDPGNAHPSVNFSR